MIVELSLCSMNVAGLVDNCKAAKIYYAVPQGRRILMYRKTESCERDNKVLSFDLETGLSPFNQKDLLC